MQNLCQLGVRDAELPAPDRRHTSDGGVIERVAKGVSADHSGRAHDYKALWPAVGTFIYGSEELQKRSLKTSGCRCHDSARSSIQST